MHYDKNTVYITGLSKSNVNDPITAVYNSFLLCLIIDKDSDKIIDVTSNSICEATVEFIKSMLLGYSIVTDIDIVIDEIETRFIALSQKALIVAFKDVHNKYMIEVKNKVKHKVYAV